MIYGPLSKFLPGDIFFKWDVETRIYRKGLLLSLDNSTAEVYWYKTGEDSIRACELVSYDEPPPYLKKQ